MMQFLLEISKGVIPMRIENQIRYVIDERYFYDIMKL